MGELLQGGVTLESPTRANEIAMPVQIKRKLGGLLLFPRSTYPALMDCSLALALQKASSIFEAAGLTELHFSAAYDHRTRRGSTQLSSHAFGRAIDVHVFDGAAGRHDVISDFERGVGTWGGIAPYEGALNECIGAPVTERGARLRTLVCRLKLESDLRIIVTPDDNDDHHDHIHLEYAQPFKPHAHAKAVGPSVEPATAPPHQTLAPSRTKTKKKVKRPIRAKKKPVSPSKRRSVSSPH